MSSATSQGQVITFYSFKGGVGRSVALLNVATVLSQSRRVLIVDFDLEAPGLHKYLGAFTTETQRESRGLLSVLQVMRNSKELDRNWQDAVINVLATKPGRLDLLPAGKVRSNDYSQQVQEFDWDTFFKKYRGSQSINDLRSAFLDEYDFILIDSRTGFTDTGGICTVLLPDILAMVFTGNEQSLEGAVDVAERALTLRAELPEARMPQTILPIPSRIDRGTEFEESKKWQGRFSECWQNLCQPWLPIDISFQRVIDLLTVPYVAYYSFGEKLAVLEDSLHEHTSPAFTYGKIAELLQHDFEDLRAWTGDQAREIQPSRHVMHQLRATEFNPNSRQIEILAKTEFEQGGVNSGWCRKRFGISYDTANRDLTELVKKGWLKKVGKGRSTHYVWRGEPAQSKAK